MPLNTNVRNAVILAAGTGNRLFPLTQSMPKPLTRVSDQSILFRTINNLQDIGVSNVAIVVGYLGEQIADILADAFPNVTFDFIHNDRYATTNNIFSLWLARDHFAEDFLLLEADVVFDGDCLNEIASLPSGTSACLVSPKEFYMDGACVELTGFPVCVTAPKQVPVSQMSKGLYKTVNFYRLSAQFASDWLLHRLTEKVEAGDLAGYYETLFADAIEDQQEVFRACVVAQDKWFEIDNLNDLDIAEFREQTIPERQLRLEGRHGGYWRYPVTDHCLLYNFHFPPKKLFEHFSARLDSLVREYPSSQKQVAAYLSSYYGVPEAQLLVANGVSEILPIVLEGIDRPLLIPVPTFNEYEAVVPGDMVLRYPLSETNGFTIDPDALLSAAVAGNAGTIVLISPNNPTGNAIPQDDLKRILRLAEGQGIEVILDESFVDFQENGRRASFLSELDAHPNLVVLFSLSKSHGIGGIRIGLMASSNKARIAKVRADMPIWNINSFAEEYLRMFSAFRSEYETACHLVRTETRALVKALDQIDGITAYPTDANFVFCRLDERLGTARFFIRDLLGFENIFLKDCSGKSMPGSEQYFRVSSRSATDNARLVRAITELLNHKIARDMVTARVANV